MAYRDMCPMYEDMIRITLERLHAEIGFKLWMLTRVDGEDWVILTAEDHGYGVKSGDVFNWADSYCCRMVVGDGPEVAPDAQAIPAYTEARVNQALKIGAYMGFPVYDNAGALFGTLCGIDPQPHSATLEHWAPFGRHLAAILGMFVSHEANRQAEAREILSQTASLALDSETGATHEILWKVALEDEELRARRLGSKPTLLIVRSARIASVSPMLKVLLPWRPGAILAKTAEDELTFLLPESSSEEIAELGRRVRKFLGDVECGVAWRHPVEGLEFAFEDARRRLGRSIAA